METEGIILTVTNSASLSSARTSTAMDLAAKISEHICLSSALLVTGPDILKTAGEIAKETASDIFAVETGQIALAPEAFLKIFEELVNEINPSFIVFPDIPEYSAVAPALAARLDSAWIPSVTGIISEGRRLLFSRSVWGGKYLAAMESQSKRTVITVSSSDFGQRKIIKDKLYKVRFMDTPEHESASYVEGWTYGAKAESGLKDAKVIISAGQGMGGPENTELIKELGNLIPGSALGCSRPVCDQGWMEYRHQVGITGAIVAPKLYMACGISGSSQHIQGMQESEMVIVVNKDPNAPFFNHSDIGIVEDVCIFLPELIRQLSQN